MVFQYPLFRIVDCFYRQSSQQIGRLPVSISALSDRGLLQDVLIHSIDCCSVSISALSDRGLLQYGRFLAYEITLTFQYPLFRIVDCFTTDGDDHPHPANVSISALSDRGLLQQCKATAIIAEQCFNIRSFGSWIASPSDQRYQTPPLRVSISALSDRGLLL